MPIKNAFLETFCHISILVEFIENACGIVVLLRRLYFYLIHSCYIVKGNWNYFAAVRNEKRAPKLEATHLEKAKELYTKV